MFSQHLSNISALISNWEPKLLSLSEEVIILRRNAQNRNIKQILGHLVDSISNNTHRIIHLQNLSSPLTFPNYATNGNNDRWIAIQNYADENWYDLVQLWKYSLKHFCHVVENVDESKLENEWIAGSERMISLQKMIEDFLPHLYLHLNEIDELINP
jgi:hypothetical protein